MAAVPTTVLQVAETKPNDALNLLAQRFDETAEERANWTKRARIAAVTGSCPRSLASLDSGVKHWLKYIKIVHGAEKVDSMAFPPRMDDVLGWSNMFRYNVFCHSLHNFCTCLHTSLHVQICWHFRKLPQLPKGGLSCQWVCGTGGGPPSHQACDGGNSKKGAFQPTPKDVYSEVRVCLHIFFICTQSRL